MKTFLILAFSMVLLSCGNKDANTNEDTPLPPVPSPGASDVFNKLVWSDEFDGQGLPDDSKWGYEQGYVRNGELQYYAVKRLDNARVENGNLIITALNDSAVIDGAMRPISSASLITQNKGDWKYGRIEVRAKLPICLGSWPAIWMMPTQSVYGGWPDSGEIDIMENVGFDPNKIYFTVHTGDYNSTKNNARGSSASCSDAGTAFHIYAVEWFEDHIDWFLDSQKTFTVKNDGTGWGSWPFDQPFYLIVNFAFGGGWGGQQGVDVSKLPQQYVIDYVRVFQ